MKRTKITKPSKHADWTITITFAGKTPTTQDNIEQSVLRALQTDRFGFEGVATVTAAPVAAWPQVVEPATAATPAPPPDIVKLGAACAYAKYVIDVHQAEPTADNDD